MHPSFYILLTRTSATVIIAMTIHINRRIVMRTVQMTLDDDLVELIDNIVKKLKTSRSAFARQALREAIESLNVKGLEENHRKGYALHPAAQDEFSVWENEQNWGDQ